MSAFDDLLNLKVAAARARIQVGIEQSAFEALVLMGRDGATLEQARALVRNALAQQARCEAELAETQDDFDDSRDSGVEPFNAAKWALTCRVVVLENGSGVRVYKNRYQLDSWFSDRSRSMSLKDKAEARRIYKAIKAQAYGAHPFNAEIFEAVCAAASGEAASGCGLSDVLWSQRATSAMGSVLALVDPSFLEQARKIAACQGWMDDAEVKSMNEMISEEGLCSHGLDPDCCPSGCGDLDDGDESDWSGWPPEE
jgi:hypothetical protein